MRILNYAQRILSKLLESHGPIIQMFNSMRSSLEIKFYTIRNFRFPFKVAIRTLRLWPRFDKDLLNREPRIEFELFPQKLIKIDKMYTPTGEIRIDDRPYAALYELIKPIILKYSIKSILEIGCTSGNLLEKIKLDFPDLKIQGIEIFEFLKTAAPPTISQYIHITDLRKHFDLGMKYDLVICLEVGEHIDPNKLDIFLDNIKFHSLRYLLMSWSNSYPPSDAPPQHLSPLHRWQFRRLVESWGFKLEKEKTKNLYKQSIPIKHFHFWWRDSLSFFRVID